MCVFCLFLSSSTTSAVVDPCEHAYNYAISYLQIPEVGTIRYLIQDLKMLLWNNCEKYAMIFTIYFLCPNGCYNDSPSHITAPAFSVNEQEHKVVRTYFLQRIVMYICQIEFLNFVVLSNLFVVSERLRILLLCID